ncbi:MAG TPA: AIR synthase related protein, partial [Halococcus sp.]|nr:AIR synthase related protein [Halococcus sp.]
TERVEEIAARFDLGCSIVGEVTEGNYTCIFDGDVVADVPADFLTDGALMHDLPAEAPAESERDLPSPALETAVEQVVKSPNTASREWVYRQYDHEVGLRTALGPGDDSAVMAIHETEREGSGIGLALSAGAEPNWTAANPKAGAKAVALENATNLTAKGATPLAAVDCLNGGNPEKSDVYGGFSAIVDGLAEMCSVLSIPVVGGNVSLYNDSVSGPIPPTPTVAMVGARAGYDSPPTALTGDGTLLLVGDRALAERGRLGGSVYLDSFGGTDRFPTLPENPKVFVETLAAVADDDETPAVHDVSHGGLCVTLAEMVSPSAGAVVELDTPASTAEALFHEQPGRAVIETKNPAAVREAFADVAPVHELGESTDTGTLELTVNDSGISVSAETISDWRTILEREMA